MNRLSNIMVCFFFFLFGISALLIPGTVFAQAGHVTSTTPAANSNNIPANTNITVIFDANIDGGTITNDTFNVDGSQSGMHTSTFSGGGTQTITCNPNTDFLPGEVVTVSLTTGIKSTGGDPLADAYTFQFTVAATGTGNFSTQNIISTLADGAWCVHSADLDGDGDLDVLSASYFSGNKIAWYENTDGNGTFSTEQIVTTSANGANSVNAADIDGDGDMDVLSTSYNDGKISWYENTDGNGTFGIQQVITTSTSGPTAVYAADIDGDGDLDVLSSSRSDSKIAWYENLDGTGTFSAQKIISTSANGGESVIAVDLDGDGDLDVLSASDADNKIAWYENTDGNGSFGVQQIISTLVSSAEYVYAVDLDGDGDPDILSASANDDKIAWYENTDGNGTFSPQKIITNLADGATSVFAVDMDGDGDPDVLSASANDDKIAWYENTDGNGTFGPQKIVTTSANGANMVYAADLDGDGDLDVLSASANDDKIAWYRNFMISPPPGNALDLDDHGGSNDYVEVPDNTLLQFSNGQALTIEVWVKPTYTPLSSEENVILTKRIAGGSTDGYALFINSYTNNDGRILFETKTAWIETKVNTITWDVWQHIAVVIPAAGPPAIYLNGTPQLLDDNSVNLVASADPFRIGRFADNWGNSNMQIDEVRIWRIARTQAEIFNNMNKILTGAEAGLAAYYRFDQGRNGIVNTDLPNEVIDYSPNCLKGTLNTFSLTGSSSNWVFASSHSPILTTTLPTLITGTTATGNGTIFSIGSGNATQRGFVRTSLNTCPTLSSNQGFSAEPGSFGTGVFTGSITGLTPGTQYWVRAYTTNSSGTTYGETQTFTTLATSPEMDVRGNLVSIIDGDATPTAADHTDFGNVNVGGSFDRIFAIWNTGTANLTLTVPITLIGADFSVISQPAPPVIAGGSTTFVVRFTPTAAGLRAGTVSIANTDTDENPYDFSIQGTGINVGFTVGPISGPTTEAGGQATFTVRLSEAPTADVTLPVSSSDTTEGTVSPASLTFTPLNWNANQIVTVTGVDDPVADGDQAYAILLSAAASADTSYDGLDPTDVPATNTDNDSAGFSVGPISGPTTEAGGQATFTVVLNSQPTADVVIPVSSSNLTEGTVSPASLTFTSLNWNAPQTVTVTGVDDLVADGNQAYVIALSAVASADPGYLGLDPADVPATNTDNDSAGFTIGPISGNTTEAGGQATFTVVLNSQPTADVVIPVGSSDVTEGTVSPASLTFTPLNWNAPRTVTVTGADDSVADGDQAYAIVLSAAASADPNLNGTDPADVAATNTDDDSPGFTVGPISGNTTEAAGQATFTVTLNSQPTANVVIPVSSSDITEGTVLPASLTFTAVNWNAPQVVTLTGVDDLVADGDQVYSVVLSAATSADPKYSGLDPADVSVTNTDNDSAGFTVGPVSGNTTEAGGQAMFTVVLNSQPTADVGIPMSSSDITEGTVSLASLTFTAINWNAPQTVTVTGADDPSADGDQVYSIILSPAVSADPNYSGRDPADVPVTNTDNDSAGFTLGPITGNTTEAGGQATFTVVLNSQPTMDVTVAAGSSDTSEGTASPAALIFTSLNWNATQTVTMTGVNDSIEDGNQNYTVVLFPAVSGDPNYNGSDPPDVSVTNTDDDSAGFTTGPISGNTTEAGGQAFFTLVLNSQPTANVTVAVNSSDVSEGTVSPATLIFTPLNWNALQTVTVNGVDDPAADGNQTYSIILQPGVSADPLYNGADPTDALLGNTDNDFAGFTAGPISGDVTEAGGQAVFTVSLNTQPSADVTIPVASSDPSEGTISTANLIFTPLNWNAPQTVTVTGADDFVADGNQSFFIRLSPAASADPNYNGLDPADVPATNTDDETAGFAVTAVTGDTREDGTQASFTVCLTSRPLGDVALDVASSDMSEGTVLPAQLVFAGANWSAPQTVTVTGQNDDMTDGNQTYSVRLTTNAGNTTDTTGYAALDPPDRTFINIDDETAGFTVGVATTETSEDETFAEFFIRLNSMPSGDVAVSVTSSDLSEGTALPATLAFTGANWNADQKVTVTGADDDIADGTQSYAILLSTDPAGTTDATGYASLDPPDVRMTNTDDETAGFTIGQISGPVGEDGTTATFTIRLNSEPTGDVKINATSSDSTEGTVFPSGILFTKDNWKSPATVTVTGVNDDIADRNMPFFIRLSVDPSGTGDTTGYLGLDPPDVAVLNTDDDTAGFIVSAIGRETTEQGGEVALAIRLTSEPAGNVGIIAESSDTSEAILFPAGLLFTPANWMADQRITIRGVDDAVVDGNQPFRISLTVNPGQTAGSAAYVNLNLPDEVFTNIDDETAGFTLGPVNGNTSEDGESAFFTIRLNSEPAGNVVIRIVSQDPTEGRAFPDILTFTPANWNIEQNVTIAGVDDFVADGAQSHVIRLSVESVDAAYAGLDPGGVMVVTVDDETAGFTIGLVSGDVSEDGATAFFTIRLNSEPVGNVWINLTSSDPSEGTVFPGYILFTPENWRSDQTVAVTGIDDDQADGDPRFFIRLTVDPNQTSAPAYAVLDPGDVAVINRDNDSAPDTGTDSDGDGVPDALDLCPTDPNKTASGQTGCGAPETDSDDDGVPDYYDGCPNDPEKIDPGITGCGFPDFTNFCPCELGGDGTVLPGSVFTGHPVGISPPNESAITADSVTIVVGPATEDTKWIHWRVRRINETEWEIYDATLPGETEYIVGGLERGVKYAWQAGFESVSADEISWSPEYTFKSGYYEIESARVDPGTSVADYQLISFTTWPSDPKFAETLGPVMGPDLDRQNFRIASYAHEKGCFVEYGCDIFKVEPGRAYWFLARNGLDMRIRGVPVSLTEDFELKLFFNANANEGWNMIASPNDADYFWGDLLLITYGENGQVVYGPTALSEMPWPNDHIYPTLWEFENGYFMGGATEIVRGAGYWVCVKQAGVSLIFPAQDQISPGSVKPSDPDFLDPANAGPPPPKPANINETECCPDVDSGGGNTCFVQSAQNQFGWLWLVIMLAALYAILASAKS